MISRAGLRATSVFVLALGFAKSDAVVCRASDARAGPAAAVVSVAVGATLRYVLCPDGATTRAGCVASGEGDPQRATRALRSAAERTHAKHIVLFVPGFRTSFAEGRADAERIANVFGSRVLVVQVDWGSAGKLGGYEADAHAARASVPAFAALVTDLHRYAPDIELGVFAHSMGSRVAAGAMAIVRPGPGGVVVRNTVLAAPDLAFGDYERAIARDPDPFGRVTVYTSKHDFALLVSDVIHIHRRLGQFTLWKKQIANTDVVDASLAGRDHVGHGYAIHVASVIADIGAIFLDAPVPHAAWVRTGKSATLWTFVPSRAVPYASVGTK